MTTGPGVAVKHRCARCHWWQPYPTACWYLSEYGYVCTNYTACEMRCATHAC